MAAIHDYDPGIDWKLRILMIDDDEPIRESVKAKAVRNQIDVVCADNLKDGIAELETHYQAINFVLLDAMCHIDKGDQTAEMDFVVRAVHELDGLAFSLGKRIPYAIFTAAFATVEPLFDWKCRVFDKAATDIEKELLPYIQTISNQTGRGNFTMKFPELTRFIISDFDEDFQNTLFMTYERIYSPSEYLTNLRDIRWMLEVIIDLFKTKAKKNGLSFSGNFHDSLEALKNKGLLTKHLYFFAKNVYVSCSEYAAHPARRDSPLNLYTALQYYYGIIELLCLAQSIKSK